MKNSCRMLPSCKPAKEASIKRVAEKGTMGSFLSLLLPLSLLSFPPFPRSFPRSLPPLPPFYARLVAQSLHGVCPGLLGQYILEAQGQVKRLSKTFLRISRIGNIPLTRNLARVFAYIPPFISHHFGLYLLNGFDHDFYFDLFSMAWHWKPAIGVRVTVVSMIISLFYITCEFLNTLQTLIAEIDIA